MKNLILEGDMAEEFIFIPFEEVTKGRLTLFAATCKLLLLVIGTPYYKCLGQINISIMPATRANSAAFIIAYS